MDANKCLRSDVRPDGYGFNRLTVVEDFHGVPRLEAIMDGFADDRHAAAADFPPDRIAGK